MNVYAGKNSVAKIPVQGKVDTKTEILAIAYALAYDLANLQLLTRKKGELIKADVQTVNGRFNVLYILAHKHAKSAVPIIKRFHELAIKRLHGMPQHTYLQQIRAIALKHLPQHLVNLIEQKVDEVNDYLHQPFSLYHSEQIRKFLFGI
ncbi:MAG: hypothetical protein QXL82_03650 [Candidatus Aenigmatarchaeota archaeon]